MRAFSNLIVISLLSLGSFWFGCLAYQNHWAEPEKPPSITSVAPKAISAATLAGEALELNPENLKRPTLLLVLSTDCRYCEQNAPQWKGLVDALRGAESAPAVFALSLSEAEDTTGYLEANDLKVPILLINQTELATLGLRGVPGTVALDPGSEMMRSWIGVLSESETAAILTWATAN